MTDTPRELEEIRKRHEDDQFMADRYGQHMLDPCGPKIHQDRAALLEMLSTRAVTQPTREEDERDGLLTAIEKRREHLLEWLQRSIGTAWECPCGVSTYHQYAFECQECGKQAPDLHVVAFRLGASASDPDGDPTDKVKLDNYSDDDIAAAYARGQSSRSPMPTKGDAE